MAYKNLRENIENVQRNIFDVLIFFSFCRVGEQRMALSLIMN